MGLEDKRDELMGRRFIDGWMMEGNLQIYVVFFINIFVVGKSGRGYRDF